MQEGHAKQTEEEFEAVVVAIGNYHEPNLVSRLRFKQATAFDDHFDSRCALSKRVRVRAPLQPDIAGMDAFPGLQLHCHNFRHNEPFRDQRVLVVGASYSGVPLSPPCHAPTHLATGCEGKRGCLNMTDLSTVEGVQNQELSRDSIKRKGVRSP